MSATGNSYSKVPKVSGRLFTSDRLFYNSQHILVVESGYFQETYRKIAYIDVCGFSICESKTRLVWGIVWTSVSALFGIFCVVNSFQSPLLIGTTGLAIVALGINMAMGKSYRCILSTMFSDVPLKTITRKKKAFLFRSFLDEKVSEVQGRLTREEARDLIEKKASQVRSKSGFDLANRNIGEPEESTSPFDEAPSPDIEGVGDEKAELSAPPPLPAQKGLSKIHWAFSIALGLFGISCMGNYFFAWYSGFFTGLIFVTSMVVSIFAAIRKIDSPRGVSLGKLFVGGIGFHFVAAIVAYLMWILFIVNEPSTYEANPLGMYQLTSPVADISYLLTGIVALVFSGLAAFKMTRFED